MADGAVKKVSLLRETFAAIKATASEWWPWILVFGIFFGALQLMGMQLQGNNPVELFNHQHPEIVGHPDVLKKNPELYKQYMTVVTSAVPGIIVAVSAFMLGLFVVYAIAFYTFSITSMRMTLPAGIVKPSVSGFFYWLGKAIWKYLRPILWFLLPIIGPFFHVRSVVRRALVTPLALLQKGDELKMSWDMTEGNWWRLFGNQMLLVLCLFLVGIVLGICVGIMSVFINPKAAHSIAAIAQGMAMSLGVMASATYACVAYRVLLQEQTAKPPTP